MSRILFRHIFWDLFRIFLLANGALAGIMSFAGLLKPLTQNGLDAGQVGKLLTYFTPSMMAYSFPIAALFATTVVYGRMSADNEVTACRATGIPHWMIALPALVLGLVVAIISLLFLCFIVPNFTLKVEKVIYSNLAAFITTKIEKNHQWRPGGKITIYAQRAESIPPDPNDPYVQRVVLDQPTVVQYEKVNEKSTPELKGYLIPDEFWMARKATLYIRTDENGDNAELTAVLDGGLKFPRRAFGGFEGGVKEVSIGPIPLESKIRENTKFMDIQQLKELDKDKRKSRKIANLRLQFIAEEQEGQLHDRIRATLDETNQYIFVAMSESYKDVYSLSRAPGDELEIKGDQLVLTARQGRTIRLTQERNGVPSLNANCAELRMRVRSDVKTETMHIAMDMGAVTLHEPDGDIERGSVSRGFDIHMPADIATLSNTPVEEYATSDPNGHKLRRWLMRELIVLRNEIASELNARGAFAVSCLFLVMAGCALGMMFKSGNFLSAFALSFIPALLTITLIIAGQRTCGNIPLDRWWEYRDPLQLGIALIWSGNVAVFLLAVGLLWRLHRT